MRFERRAFTLLELIVTLAILVILAGVLFPVLTRARIEALRVGCLSNFRQVTAAALMYSADYDDVFVPVNHRTAGGGDSSNDRTWVQLLLPYGRSFQIFFCPADPQGFRTATARFDADLVPGDTSSGYFSASQSVNVGYNHQYLSPILRSTGGWEAMPRSASVISDPASSLFFVDSTGPTSTASGGSWLVSAPCRYEATPNGQVIDTFSGRTGSVEVFTTTDGWPAVDQPVYSEPIQYGGAWPRHGQRFTLATLAGGTKSVSLRQLTDGCDLGANWSGLIRDNRAYLWDIR
ncbi:MAG: type II secretion system protein [Fimbriimonadaceae bacterium]|nr:type II secretion system protein [Fimbriimonadaceae bacterium]